MIQGHNIQKSLTPRDVSDRGHGDVMTKNHHILKHVINKERTDTGMFYTARDVMIRDVITSHPAPVGSCSS